MQVTVKKPQSRVSRVKTSTIGRNASKVNYSGSAVSGVTNVSDAIDQLANKFFQSTAQPATGVNEGDLWYDLTTEKLKLNDGSDWGLISGAASNLNDDFFRFTTSSTLISGNVAEYINNTDTVFAVGYDGVVKLKDVDELPSTVAEGGVVFYSGNLYLGVSE